MPTYFRFGVGPFRFSQRLSKTAAQKRAAQRAAADRRAHRAERKAERAASRPEAIAARQAEAAARAAEEYDRRQWKAERAAREHMYKVTKCAIDGLAGGSFTMERDGIAPVNVEVSPDLALTFLPLKRGDLVTVRQAAADGAVEYFCQVSRASGAIPRSPITIGYPSWHWQG